jgi:lysozyme
MRKLLLVLFLSLFQNLSFISTVPAEGKTQQTIILAIDKPIRSVPNKIEAIAWTTDSLSNEVLASIKRFEGLRLTSYNCPANQKTIGYGHCIKSSDNISDTITVHQAENLLKRDFAECIKFVKEHVKGTSIEGKNNKVLALAHFVFNVGSGNFEKSTILTAIRNGEFVAENLLKWVHYRDKDNNLVTSEYLRQIRQYEVDLYNSVS